MSAKYEVRSVVRQQRLYATPAVTHHPSVVEYEMPEVTELTCVLTSVLFLMKTETESDSDFTVAGTHARTHTECKKEGVVSLLIPT